MGKKCGDWIVAIGTIVLAAVSAIVRLIGSESENENKKEVQSHSKDGDK